MIIPSSRRRLGAALATVLALGAPHAARCLPPSSASERRVLFAFDDRALPFQHGLRLQLIDYHLGAGEPNNVVLPPGPPGSPDAGGCYFYGTVLPVGPEYWMWYLGCPEQARKGTERVCVAKSRDGVTWTRPDLGLVDFGGSRHNNAASLDGGAFLIDDPCLVYYEPEDPNPARRFKMVYTTSSLHLQMAVAYSPDGLRWTNGAHNPVGPWLEASGLMKWRGAYYIGTHGRGTWTPNGDWMRVLDTYVSYDFDHWVGTPALGFRRDALPPRPVTVTGTVDGEQVHLGASLWNRGNVILGFYGMWHGVPSNDRREVSIDIGLLVSHDALHYVEPIPDFRIVAAKENIYAWPRQAYIGAPALAQGQAFANVGDQTFVWYGSWNTPSDGVRLARWERDRLGYLQPFVTTADQPNVISEPIKTDGRPVAIEVNAGGLNALSQIKVSLLDEQFRPLSGYGAGDCTGPTRPGLRQRATWGAQTTVSPAGAFRIRVDFAGVRPEDAKLYALYIQPAP